MKEIVKTDFKGAKCSLFFDETAGKDNCIRLFVNTQECYFELVKTQEAEDDLPEFFQISFCLPSNNCKNKGLNIINEQFVENIRNETEINLLMLAKDHEANGSHVMWEVINRKNSKETKA